MSKRQISDVVPTAKDLIKQGFDPYYCGRCTTRVAFRDAYCSACGAELRWWWRCPCVECGEVSGVPARFCARCGTELPQHGGDE